MLRQWEFPVSFRRKHVKYSFEYLACFLLEKTKELLRFNEVTFFTKIMCYNF